MACSTPDAQVLGHLATEPVQVALGPCDSGKMVDTRLAQDGTDLAGSRCVMTKRASG